MSSAKKGRRVFLQSYSAADSYLLRPKLKEGRPGLIEGVGKNGQPVLIREWKRSSLEDERVLDELWKNELRLLYRLSGSPGASDHIANLIDAGKDRSGYYIVIGPGQRRPVALYLPSQSGNLIWQRQTAAPQNRRVLWGNLQRIAAGLEVLHLQGLIHCNLDAWSILSSGGSEPDFQLTGFEWAMRLAGGSRHLARSRSEDPSRAYSFMDDWSSFAQVAASLLNIREERLTNSKLAASDVSEASTSDEVSLLRDLIYPPHLLQIDGAYVRNRIESIVSSLQNEAAADDAHYHLVAAVDQSGPLSQAIREASDLAIEMDDIQGQLEFIRSDLSQEPRILTAEGKTGTYHVLRGVSLVYPLSQYTVRNTQRPTWEFAKCERAEAAQTWKGRVTASASVQPSSLSIMTFSDATKRVGRLRGRVLNWDSLLTGAETAGNTAVLRQQRFLAAVTMLHALELVLASLDLFPVEIVKRESDGEEGDKLVLSLTEDQDRQDLCTSLGLKPYPERLRALLETDAVREDEGWLLADRKRLGRRTGSDTEMEFDRADFDVEPPTYTFRTKVPTLPGKRDAILVPGSLRGTLEQFQRRGKAIQGLRDHAELLSTLSDPRSTVKTSIEEVEKDGPFLALDPPKQIALEEMFSVLPVYGVQGPPGVGKTYLVREAVKRTFKDEPASRVLLSAQSHFTVDHLMHELVKDWEKEPGIEPLAVRSRSKEAKAPPSPFDVQTQRRHLIVDVLKGQLYQSASQSIRSRLDLMLVNPQGEERSRTVVDQRTLDALVLRAANVVFATSNSRDLERLYSERGQFDWTIVEEAGKATGVELLMPLLLSHRRLMIGDHRQLPPFGSDQIERLLDNPKTLRTSLGAGLQFVERDFKGFIGDELMDILENEDAEKDMERLCTDAKRVLTFFATLIEDELTRQKKPGARRPNQAQVLTIQHRMHPTIADLISHCFYADILKTWPAAAEKFKNSNPPVVSKRGKMAFNAPITIVDMPYQQTTKGGRNIERVPRYTNLEEIEAVLEILRTIEPANGDAPPTLAILSPYNRQIQEIRRRVNDEDPALVRRFSPSVRNNDWFSSVDSFQGNEADIVILSLVRNNHHSSIRSAFGFLSQEPRMNVALSRAKWRLFVITSLDFLRTVVFPIGASTPPEINFLRLFLEWQEAARKAGTISVIVPAQLSKH